MFDDYTHIVSVVTRDDRHFIRIERMFGTRKDLYTEIEIPAAELQQRWEAFDKLSESLGKSICIDSPSIRKALDIDRD